MPLYIDIPRAHAVEGRDDHVCAPVPKIEFPKFDGENPKLWQKQCETYFEEEDSIPYKKKSYSKSEYKETSKSKWVSHSEDVSHSESKRADGVKMDNKIEYLKSFMRIKGLCFVCGDKWSRTHKCPSQVSLHIIEELLDVLQINHAEDTDSPASESEEEAVMLLGTTRTANLGRKKSFRLQGTIGRHQVLILVDSGNVSSFINNELTTQLQCTRK